ncbi:MAG: dihydroorotate dehydrogenase [Lachnospiraceae bacterium]|nr:dihydroorotate dehydrogenase [Lachnospiraceae bacterium]
MRDLSIDAFGLHFKNPIMTCSGTFASGIEYSEFVDLNRLGAVVTKGVSHEPWSGNPTPRIAETPSGMLNAIGLQNPGTKTFIERDLEELKDYDTNIVVNVCGHSLEEYKKAVLDLNDTNANLFEINISCPNVKAGGLSFGTDPKGVYEITSELKQISKKPIVMKLTPNVTDIKVIAKAAEEGGADGISLINTLTGMKIDVEKQIFSLANKTGGLSGPAIHPVAVRMVYECASVVNIPIIGMGGVFDYSDALELMMAGASLVAVGSANFKNPCATTDIIDGIDDYMERHNIKNIKEIIGLVK